MIPSTAFESQLRTLQALGYRLNPGVTPEDLLKTLYKLARPSTDVDSMLSQKPFEQLYYCLGWSKDHPKLYYTDDCIWYDLEFIDPSTEYIEFMKRMGAITHGEIEFTDITMDVDDKNYEWIHFTVNGIQKSWRLEEQGYIDDSFFQRFSYLPKELHTPGRYTYYDDGSQQFVIDYATEEEQAAFIRSTHLHREWLGEGNHFREFDPNR